MTLTLDTYAHVLPSMQQTAFEKLEKILFEKQADYKSKLTVGTR